MQSQGGRIRNVKQVGFEPGLEDSYRRCGSDKIRQTGGTVNFNDAVKLHDFMFGAQFWTISII